MELFLKNIFEFIFLFWGLPWSFDCIGVSTRLRIHENCWHDLPRNVGNLDSFLRYLNTLANNPYISLIQKRYFIRSKVSKFPLILNCMGTQSCEEMIDFYFWQPSQFFKDQLPSTTLPTFYSFDRAERTIGKHLSGSSTFRLIYRLLNKSSSLFYSSTVNFANVSDAYTHTKGD